MQLVFEFCLLGLRYFCTFVIVFRVFLDALHVMDWKSFDIYINSPNSRDPRSKTVCIFITLKKKKKIQPNTMSFRHVLQFIQLRNDLPRFPTSAHKEFAQKCNFNQWLKIYANSRAWALWMLRWVTFDIGQLPHSVLLSEYRYDPTRIKHLRKFFDEHNHLYGLTIPSRLLMTEIKQEIHRLNWLNEIIIRADQDFEFPIFLLPCLESIGIINLNHAKITQIENLKRAYVLKNFYASNVILDAPMANILAELKLRILSLTGVDIESSIETQPDIFKDKHVICLSHCSKQLVLYLLQQSVLSAHEIVIEVTDRNITIDVTRIRDLPKLKHVKICMQLRANSQYLNLISILESIAFHQTCKWILLIRMKYVGGDQVNSLAYLGYQELKHYIADLLRKTCSQNPNIQFQLMII